jgi:hypothetical protein
MTPSLQDQLLTQIASEQFPGHPVTLPQLRAGMKQFRLGIPGCLDGSGIPEYMATAGPSGWGSTAYQFISMIWSRYRDFSS